MSASQLMRRIGAGSAVMLNLIQALAYAEIALKRVWLYALGAMVVGAIVGGLLASGFGLLAPYWLGALALRPGRAT